MHPAFSVLFFTVTSGLGYGFLFWLLIMQASGWISFETREFLIYCSIAFALFTLGLLSSTQHLANPKNAWRSFVRFRTSWLSREAVLAVMGYPLFALTIYSMIQAWTTPIILALTTISLLWIIALVYCTAMIYASLKTIPQWNNYWVRAAFVMFAAYSGLLAYGLASQWSTFWLVILAGGLLLASGVVKIGYYRHIGKPTRSSINTATSFSQAQVTLFDSGQSSKNFSQREFIYEVGPQTTKLARTLVLLLVFVIPAICLAFYSDSAAAWIAVISAYLGLLLERWLFFIEAKHVIRHFYDALHIANQI